MTVTNSAKKGKSYFDLKGSDFYRYESSDYDDKEVIWLCVDMAPLNRSIGVPLDPVWTADGTAKWTVHIRRKLVPV